MTTVCIVGDPTVDVRAELLSRETAREAIAPYDLDAPWINTIAMETVSLGMAVSLLNDLNWYLVRFATLAMVQEPSISDREWLSRALASAVRDGDVEREESDRFVAIYGVDKGRLVEPLYTTRRPGAALPSYDLRDVDETVVVRVTPEEFGG